MSITLLLGLGIVIAAAIALVPMIFTARSEPATTGPVQERASTTISESASTTTIRVPERVSVHPAWWERLRGVGGLLLFTVGAGMATAVGVGLIVLVIGLAIQH